MPSLRFTLSNNGVVTGAYSVPTSSSTLPEHRPLVVGLHGGTYDHQYFEATPKYSASRIANTLGVPFVAIDRPCYGGTTSIFPPPEDSTFPHETGLWLHRYILPKLWAEIGVPNGCNCIVLLCHSLGVMGGVVAASLHAQDSAPAYPLGGIITSGLGDKQSEFMTTNKPELTADRINYTVSPTASKDKLMFKPGTVEAEVLEQSERLNSPSPPPETALFAATWLPSWKEKYAAHVRVPVMFCLVEGDAFFISNEEEVEVCVRAFKSSPRVDGSLLKGAPHCIELSKWSQGWYSRCFGFALECAATLALAS
ncbi:hypothetical protein F5X68DRAFT_241662 [Plectosphaerella plurivora]|uniref:AB hydrolase-1 domain-containing protein n=1 Tax=Plectosphaerella plurivora TaxID=936078 RepID=A0A9P9AAN4_9PEZI|nr:hypothetical protein F5X68DRAFT_241662 [Plectosphaerella plurivora]